MNTMMTNFYSIYFKTIITLQSFSANLLRYIKNFCITNSCYSLQCPPQVSDDDVVMLGVFYDGCNLPWVLMKRRPMALLRTDYRKLSLLLLAGSTRSVTLSSLSAENLCSEYVTVLGSRSRILCMQGAINFTNIYMKKRSFSLRSYSCTCHAGSPLPLADPAPEDLDLPSELKVCEDDDEAWLLPCPVCSSNPPR